MTSFSFMSFDSLEPNFFACLVCNDTSTIGEGRSGMTRKAKEQKNS
jgi:hypothetical protein